MKDKMDMEQVAKMVAEIRERGGPKTMDESRLLMHFNLKNIQEGDEPAPEGSRTREYATPLNIPQ